MSLGQRIRERRKELNLTQIELANAAGVHQRQISKYENDKNEPASLTLMALSKALNVSADWLLGITDIQRPPPKTLTPATTSEENRRIHTLSDIGIRLRQSRTAVRLTVEDVAESLEVPVEEIEAYEYGSKPICVDDLLALSELYDERPEYLLFGLTSQNLSLRQELAELYTELQNVSPAILVQYMHILRSDVENIKRLAERDRERMSEMEKFRRELQNLWNEATDPERKRSLKLLLDDLGGPSASLDLKES